MRLLTFIAGAAFAMSASVVSAQSVRTEATASNGVLVTIYADDFSSRYEYSAPPIEFTDGYVLVAKITEGTQDTDAYLTGSIAYRGEWRRYSSAIFKGGAPANFIEAGREVVSCSGSRYSSGCRLRERFKILLTPAQIQTHAENGMIPIQIRAQNSSTTIMQIPTAYIEAVNEVAARRQR